MCLESIDLLFVYEMLNIKKLKLLIPEVSAMVELSFGTSRKTRRSLFILLFNSKDILNTCPPWGNKTKCSSNGN